MANDGSLSTLTEVWIVDAIGAIAGIGTSNVEFFRGIESQENAVDFVLEMKRERPLFIAVMWSGRTMQHDTERNQDARSTYSAFVSVTNQRNSAASRIGDGDSAGMNLILEQILDVIEIQYDHAGAPIQTVGWHVDTIRVSLQEALFHPTGQSIARIEIEVVESRR